MGTNGLHDALQAFATAVANKVHAGGGQPEAQLVAPVQTLLTEVGQTLSIGVTAVAETAVTNIGRPDVGVHVGGALCGYAELKAPGEGADARRYTGRNKKQFNRFSNLPNIIYTDGQEWALYRNGVQQGPLVSLTGDLVTSGAGAVTTADADALRSLFADFLSWQPIVPNSAPELAYLLAPLCRFLAESVEYSIDQSPQGPMSTVLREWRQLLFPDADEKQFADGYAQTVTFALLLARVEGSDLAKPEDAVTALGADHNLLGEVLGNIATSPQVHTEVGTAINLLTRVVQAIEPTALASKSRDPWLYFYEDFLAAYNPRLREDRGAYYTPRQVVGCQVRLVQELLITRLGRNRRLADDDVVILDPGAGTGTYPLSVIAEGLDRIEQTEGSGAVPGRASLMAAHVCSFELLVGPYAVCQLRVTKALDDRGATLPQGGPRVYLIDTLESPTAGPSGQTTLLQRPLAEAHEAGLMVKARTPVLVCIGNPPYDDQRDPSQSRKGGWVRFGEPYSQTPALLDTFLKPLTDAGQAVYRRYAYNDYLYFWRWAIWKVCEQDTTKPGIVSFITASSYLRGIPYIGIREHMRREFDEIWIIDLEGDSFGPHKTENVFTIRTPVAIAVCVRYGARDAGTPANVNYTRISGTRSEKYAGLDQVSSFKHLSFQACPTEWQAPFQPAGTGAYEQWPALSDLFPWRNPGSAAHRTWPIATRENVLEARWKRLVEADPPDRGALLVETRDRQVDKRYRPITDSRRGTPLTAIKDLDGNAPAPDIEPYAWRAFDRRWILADHRVLDTPRPPLWLTRSEHQLYFTTLTTTRLGAGPAMLANTDVPDFNHFNNRACQMIPLFRDAAATTPNVAAGLLDIIGKTLGHPVSVDEFACYVYALLAHPGYEAIFARELTAPDPHVPITGDPDLFAEGVRLGRKLIWLHTNARRFVDAREGRPGSVPSGRARNTAPVPDTVANAPREVHFEPGDERLGIGTGVFLPVSPNVWEYSVSGHRVVPYWINARLPSPPGERKSDLDSVVALTWSAEETSQLLELLWTIEASLDLEGHLLTLLDQVVTSPLIHKAAFPTPSEAERAAPEPTPTDTDQDAFNLG